MNEEAAFWNAIAESPDEVIHRVAYADWLEEQGDGMRAEFLRVESEAASQLFFLGPPPPVVQKLNELRSRVPPDWALRIEKYRLFPHDVSLRGLLFARTLIDSLSLRRDPALFDDLSLWEPYRWMRKAHDEGLNWFGLGVSAEHRGAPWLPAELRHELGRRMTTGYWQPSLVIGVGSEPLRALMWDSPRTNGRYSGFVEVWLKGGDDELFPIGRGWAMI
jgi:uncharacterized protein (TIGR02996 family)